MSDNGLFIPLNLPSDLSSELLKEYDNEETLDLLEQGAEVYAYRSFQDETEAAKYIFLILYHRVWRHRLNEDGSFKYFRDGRFLQELYLPDLERLVRWGRASIFAKFRAMKLAVNGLNLLPEQIEAYGGITVFEAVEDEVSRNGKINSKTGQIIEFKKDTNGLSPKDYIIGIVRAYSPGNTDEMRPAEIRNALRENLSDRANIWFEMITIARGSTNSGYETKWNKEEVIEGILDKQFGLMSEPNIPQDVLSEYCKRLRTKNPLKAESDGVPNQEAASVGQQETTVSSGKI